MYIGYSRSTITRTVKDLFSESLPPDRLNAALFADDLKVESQYVNE